MSDAMKWLDFSSYRLEMKIVEFAGGHRAVMLRGQVELTKPQREALAALGFRAFGRPGGPGFRTMWLLSGTMVHGVDQLEKAFPQVRRVTWERTRIMMTSPGQSPLQTVPKVAPKPVSPPAPTPTPPGGALAGLRRATVAAETSPAGVTPAPAAPAPPVRPVVSPVAQARPAVSVPAPAPAQAWAVPPTPSRPLPPRRLGPPRIPATAVVQPPPAAPAAVPPAAPVTEKAPQPAPLSMPAGEPVAKPKPRRISSPAGQFTRAQQVIEAEVPDIEFEDDSALDALHAVAQVNAFQARYEPESRIGKPIAMIPLNMASAIKAALGRIVAEHGDIDRWIARRAKWTLAELEKFVSPEQVDAVALMMAAIDRGEGAILADQTGLGKGRVLATVARICAVERKRIVFLTEKANLFTDFWRDVRDTGSEEVLGAPFLLNGDTTIVDQTSPDGEVLFASLKKPDLAKVIKQGKLPSGTRLMMATYSQFNRKGSPKIELLRSVAKGAVVIRDESHNAAGDSNTAAALASALSDAVVVHSSATYARDARNMQSYGSVLPPSLRNADLTALFRAGGNAFAEALSQALAEQGALIRREHDLSNIRIEVVDDLDRMERNRAYVDALAPILSQMAAVGRRVTELAEEKTAENAELLKELSASERKMAREKVYTMNFGAVLSALVRQVVTALLVDKCVEECVDILRSGEKPVVVIETTMEALMRDLAKGTMSEEGATGASPPLVPVEDGADEDAESESAGAEAGAKPPDYRDALRLAVQRLSELIVRKGTDDPIRVPVEEPDVVAMRDTLLNAVAELPDLSLSPIDDLRERVESRGRELFEAGEIDRPWTCDEISARSMRVANGIYENMPARDRNAVIAGFNGGRTDMVEVTRAGSTGLSLHASERVKDQRRRIMIELQIPSNVVERVQFWGRVNRRGQVCEPGFKTLSTGLAIQARNLAMQNRKVAQLSANVSASAENATSMDVPDIIDQTGNEICKRILSERPALADRMCIAMRGIDEEQAAEELYYVNKLLQRLVLIPAAEQAALYDEVIELYEDAMRELAAQGKHPHHGRELPGSWEIEKRELFDAGNPADGPVFGRPVWLATLKGLRDAAPLTSEMVETLVAQSRARLASENGEPNDLGYFAHQVEVLRRRADNLLLEALPQGFQDVKTALSAIKPNAVKIRQATLRDLRNLIARAEPGAFVTAPDEENLPATGRVVDVRPPEDDGVHLPGRWILRYVLPGDERPREISFATMLRERVFSIQPAPSQSDFRRQMLRYDNVPRGPVVQRRLMLEGNLVAAVRIAAEGRLGTAAAWTDAEGRRRRGVLIPKARQAEIASLPGSTFCKEAALEVLKRGARLEAVPSRPSDGVVIRAENGRDGQMLVVELPAEPKPVAERLRRAFEKAELTFVEDYGMLSAHVRFSAAPKVLAAYMDSSRPLYFHGRFRALALASTASLREQKAERDAAPAMAP